MTLTHVSPGKLRTAWSVLPFTIFHGVADPPLGSVGFQAPNTAEQRLYRTTALLLVRPHPIEIHNPLTSGLFTLIPVCKENVHYFLTGEQLVSDACYALF